MSESGESLNVVYRVVDADGEPLWDGTYDSMDEAISRRAREMSEHPDGDEVTIETYERVEP